MSIMAKRGKCFSCGHDHDAAPHWFAKLDEDQKKLKAATSKLAELQALVEILRGQAEARTSDAADLAVKLAELQREVERWKWMWNKDADMRHWDGQYWVVRDGDDIEYPKRPTFEEAIDAAIDAAMSGRSGSGEASNG